MCRASRRPTCSAPSMPGVTPSCRSASPERATGCGPMRRCACSLTVARLPCPARWSRSARASSSCRRWRRPSVTKRSSCCPCCTGRWARTEPCRVCSSSPTSPTSARGCSAPRCAWTRRWPSPCIGANWDPAGPVPGGARRRRRRRLPRPGRRRTGSPRVRQAGQPRLVGRRRRAPPIPRPCACAVAAAARLRRMGGHRGSGRRPARSRSASSATPRPRVSVPGEIVPTHEFYDYADKYLDGAARSGHPGRSATGSRRGDRPPRGAGLHHVAMRRNGPGRLLLRGGRPGPAPQRGQHHSGLHPVSRCTRSCGRPRASGTAS